MSLCSDAVLEHVNQLMADLRGLLDSAAHSPSEVQAATVPIMATARNLVSSIKLSAAALGCEDIKGQVRVRKEEHAQ